MLKELRIRNLAIIDGVSITFGEGMNVLTGETGAGKSIIVDALGLVLGDRAQPDLVKAGGKEAVVEAFFEVDGEAVLPDIGIGGSDGIFLRRVVSSSGKSRAYINDRMVTLQTLSEVGSSLVDIHSQYEHQSLIAPDRQREILDSYGRHFEELRMVETLAREVQTLRTSLDEMTAAARERVRLLDLMRYQVEEITAARLQPDEDAALAEERTILANMGKLRDLVEDAYGLLHASDGSCTEQLAGAATKVREIVSIDRGAEDVLTALESAIPLIEDAAIALRGFRERYAVDPGRLDEVEERLELIRRLSRKYGADVGEILRFCEKTRNDLSALETLDEKIASAGSALAEKEKALEAAASVLSGKRKRTAQRLEVLIRDALGELAMADAAFTIAVRQETDQEGGKKITPHGIDRIEFLFSANPGEPPRPLARIASGGELSRVMLGLKSILADVDRVPVLIFDEVDAGIGGQTAEVVGRKLERISRRHQIICITHLAQIARHGREHLKVEKTAKDKRVDVTVTALSGRERLDEIARMLSGSITEVSRRHAAELLGRER